MNKIVFNKLILLLLIVFFQYNVLFPDIAETKKKTSAKKQGRSSSLEKKNKTSQKKSSAKKTSDKKIAQKKSSDNKPAQKLANKNKNLKTQEIKKTNQIIPQKTIYPNDIKTTDTAAINKTPAPADAANPTKDINFSNTFTTSTESSASNKPSTNPLSASSLKSSPSQSASSSSSEKNPKSSKADEIWQKIAPLFSPTYEFNDKFGNYKSPLNFYDGKPVASPQDWKKRREEILSYWNKKMGEPPAMIDNLDIEILETTHREDFTQKKLSFYWTPNEKTTAYLLIPDSAYGYPANNSGNAKKSANGKSSKSENGEKIKSTSKKKLPAVITVYYEPETAIGLGKELRDFAYQLTKRGFVTLSIGTTESTKAQTYSIYFPSLNEAQVQPLSMLAYAAENARLLLTGLPEVDSSRIGIMGHSFGGKWAMFASCLYENFACAVWSDPGIVFDETRPDVNYWEPWYLGYSKSPWRSKGILTKENPAQGIYPELIAEGHDLHELHALMAPRPFLVSGGSEDPPKRWIPLNHAIAVNNFLGYKNRVAMSNRAEHSPNPESNEQIYLFFEYFLKYGNLSKDKKIKE